MAGMGWPGTASKIEITGTVKWPGTATTGVDFSFTVSPTPTPGPTPLPSGIAVMWDAASLSALADGAAVTSWTDAIGGSTTAYAGGGTPHTYVANSGGLPAVRLSGSAVLTTSGTNAANTAMTGAERGIIVVARNILGAGSGQVNPVLVASGTGTGLLFQATPTQTGRYQQMYDCGDAGMRTIGWSRSTARDFVMDVVNGSAIVAGAQGQEGGQVTIGGWQNAGTACCGRADILAVIVFNRAVTAADFKQVHRRYCEFLGQARPGGAAARTVSFLGDSLTQGYPVGNAGSYPFQLAAGLGLAWGTWDQMGVSGFTWSDIYSRTLPMLGNVSAATGNRSILCTFERANEAGQTGAATTGHAQTFINAAMAQDSACEIIMGTSTDQAGLSTGQKQARADYNAALVAGLSGVTTLVRLDLDPNVGVEGAAPASGGNAYYQPDGLHLTQAGYGRIDNGSYGFRAAVQARLAAA